MGILNVTPDSFYDQGRHRHRDEAVERALRMGEEGADIIDIGGERAGPGDHVAIEDELRRVIPVITSIRRQSPLPLSIDTRRARVAEAAIEAGVEIINSISGFDDSEMRRVAAVADVGIVIMHIQGKPRVPHPHPDYVDVVRDVRKWLLGRAELCLEAGVVSNRIVIDPGPGFGKTTQDDLSLIRHLSAFVGSPFPVLLAASRKPFIGDVLDLPPEERLEASLATVAWAVLQGVKIVRVHDVRASLRVVRMTEAVLQPLPLAQEIP